MGKKKHKKKQKNKRKGCKLGFNFLKNLHKEENAPQKPKQEAYGNAHMYYCMPCNHFLAYSVDHIKVEHCPDCKGRHNFYYVGRKQLDMKSLKR